MTEEGRSGGVSGDAGRHDDPRSPALAETGEEKLREQGVGVDIARAGEVEAPALSPGTRANSLDRFRIALGELKSS